MKNKKLISIISAFAMAAAMSTGVSAVTEPDAPQFVIIDQNNVSGQNVNVGFSQDPMYYVTIPADIPLSKTAAVEVDITADDVIIPYGYALDVSIDQAGHTGAGGSVFTAMTPEGASLTYSINEKGKTAKIAVQETMASFTANGTKTFEFKMTSAPVYSGDYSEQLTFKVALVPTSAVVPHD